MQSEPLLHSLPVILSYLSVVNCNIPPFVAVNERIVGLDLSKIAVGGYHGTQKVFYYPISQSLKRIWHISDQTEKTLFPAERLNGF